MDYKNIKLSLFKKLKNGISDIKFNDDDMLNIKYTFYNDLDNLYYGLNKKKYEDSLINELLNSYVDNYVENIHRIYNAVSEINVKMKTIKNMQINNNYMPYEFRKSYDYVRNSKNLFIDILTQNMDYNLLLKDLTKIMDFYYTINSEKLSREKVATINYEDYDIPKNILDAIKGVENG